ncbi:SHOCT domain-containing protein [Kitasatospora purpeofusca]|uniref:SHOCT domain-containing protein n=1 Tax=Kitasatospora purpeofusca TaxID=67352 RepID=UPI0030F1B3CC
MTTTRRVGGARKFLVLLLGLLTALGGWTLGTGWVRSVDHAACLPETSCDGTLTASALVSGVYLCLLGLFSALVLAENREPEKPQRLPLGATSAGAVSLALLGAALGNGSAHPWLFAAAAPFGLLTAVAGVRGERRIRRENRDHLREHTLAARLHTSGVTVTGTVTEVGHVGREQRGRGTGPHRLRLTVRYPGPDGRPYTLTHTGRYPVYALPTVGGEVTVRHDPLDPSAAVVPTTGAVGPRPLGDELALLAALHREGALDAAEFTAAKALLLLGGVSAGASGGL